MAVLDRFVLKAKEAACATGSRSVRSRLLPHYNYNFEPHQLIYLCECLSRVRDVPGQIVEIGCSAGKTTIFLNRFMDAVGIRKPYLCIDTFSGFTEADVSYEVTNRGKSRAQLETAWADWSLKMFRMTMAYNGLERVRVVKRDVNQFSFAPEEPIAFCLVDVDLYLPVKAALLKVHARLSEGGIVVVDDCVSDHKYDGARQAYTEFVEELRRPPLFRCGKFGVIEPVADTPAI